MDAEPGLLESLRKAVSALPDDHGLRLHLASQLLAAGLRAEAVSHLGAVLQADPANAAALTMLADLASQPAGDAEPSTAEPSTPERSVPEPARAGPAAPDQPGQAGFDWARAEADLGAVLPPMFVTAYGSAAGPHGAGAAPMRDVRRCAWPTWPAWPR